MLKRVSAIVLVGLSLAAAGVAGAALDRRLKGVASPPAAVHRACGLVVSAYGDAKRRADAAQNEAVAVSPFADAGPDPQSEWSSRNQAELRMRLDCSIKANLIRRGT